MAQQPNIAPSTEHSSGLAQESDRHVLRWENISAKPLREIVALTPATKKTAGLTPSFESAIRATGNTPISELSTEDLATVTSGLVYNLQNQPNPNDYQYIKMMGMAWSHHTDDILNGKKELPSNTQELQALSGNIHNLIPNGKPGQERLPQILEWDDNHTLGQIRDEINFLTSSKAPDRATQEDRLMEWAHKALKGARVKQSIDSGTTHKAFTIELPASQHGSNQSHVENILSRNEAKLVRTGTKFIRVIPEPDSPLETTLSTLARYNRALG